MPYSSRRPAGDGVQPDVGDLVLVVVPSERAVVALLQLRRELLVLRGQVLLEHVGRLDDVVVDAHQDQVVHVHRLLPRVRSRRRRRTIVEDA